MSRVNHVTVVAWKQRKQQQQQLVLRYMRSVVTDSGVSPWCRNQDNILRGGHQKLHVTRDVLLRVRTQRFFSLTQREGLGGGVQTG